MAKTSKFVYRGGSRTANDMRQKAKEGAGLYDSPYKSGIQVFKPKEGENWIRIMPSTWDEPDWDYPIMLHYDIGPDNARYLCLDKMKGERCAACEARLQASAEEADKLSPVKGAICWIIDRDNEAAGPQLWAIPFTKIRNEIYGRSYDKRTNASILVDDPDEGFDIRFMRTGTGTKTQYSGVEIERDPSPLHTDERIQQRWLDHITENPLPEVLNFYDADHIEKVLFGRVDSRHPDKDDEVAETQETTALRSTRRGLRTEETEEEAEETPPPRSSRRAAAPPPEEETEEEPPFEPDNRSSRRRALLAEPEEEAEPEPARTPRRGRQEAQEEEAPVATARRSLERLRGAGRR